MDLSPYLKIDNTLFTLSKSLNLLNYVQATNHFRQKRYFLSGKLRKPCFNYRKPTFNIERVRNALKEMKPPKTPLGNLYRQKIENLRIRSDIIENIDNKRKMKKCSRMLYRKPNRQLIEKAKEISRKQINAKSPEFDLSASLVEKKMRDFFDDKGLNDWNINVCKTNSAAIGRISKIFKLARNRKYSRNDYERLKVHEIMCHVYRAANGYLQPLKIFACGLAEYLTTEEGIASYLEEKYKVESSKDRKRYALRVLAVNAVYEGATFYECFNFIRDFEVDDETAWNITYRVFRGGGFLKDHVYLDGYLQIKDYLKNGGKLKTLYAGKIGLEHLDICEQLRDDGVLVPPKYLP